MEIVNKIDGKDVKLRIYIDDRKLETTLNLYDDSSTKIEIYNY